MDREEQPPFDPIDEASEESFPASDPPAHSYPSTPPGFTGDAGSIIVVNNEALKRFEARLPLGTAFLSYRHDAAGRLVLVHTEVPPAMENHGIASKLAAVALGHARDHGLRVVPLCPFVKAYLRRHPEFAPLVSPA